MTMPIRLLAEEKQILFGENRTCIGVADLEWSVWILGTDDVHPQPSLPEALQFAAEHNAVFADLRTRHHHALSMHAVVLHHGYAWTQATEHAHGLNCGIDGCDTCGPDEVAA
ncbi:hypothetical protein [Streptomyces sp. NBC_01353]|uniref:hypothetical protein n=1 Tax=Streptomyces sp. NBC_01353 TaxID=2903835 RepID=UPI002E354C6F|nr:hypothetical protein [Streptomyces sp. NBC_01353]